MRVVSHFDLYSAIIDSPDFHVNHVARNIFFNEASKHVLSRHYLDLLEKQIKNKEFLAALIKELFDKKRVEFIKSEKADNELEDEFIQLSNLVFPTITSTSIFPTAVKFDDNLLKKIPKICFISSAKKPNIDWIKLQLISKSEFSVSHLDFNTDKEIQDFFNEALSIPVLIQEANIIDRTMGYTLKTKLKGNKINYYTLRYVPTWELPSYKKDLKKDLGGKLRLFYSNNKKFIHERMIIFENIILSADNSFENLLKNEPTWQVHVKYSETLSKDWLKKCRDHFSEVQ